MAETAAKSSEQAPAEQRPGPLRRRRRGEIASELARLHLTAGNGAVARLLEPIRSELLRPGEELEPETRADLEHELGRELPEVRVHRGAGAARAAEAANATAFAAGRHVVLGARVPPLSSPEGRRVLAHELVHVIQQSGAAASASLGLVPPGSLAERQAQARSPQPAATVGLARLVEKDVTRLSDAELQAEYELAQRFVADNPAGADHDAGISYIQEIEQEVTSRGTRSTPPPASDTTPTQSSTQSSAEQSTTTPADQGEQSSSASSVAPETGNRPDDARATAAEQDPGVVFNGALARENWSDAARALAEMEPAGRRAALEALTPEARLSLRTASAALDPSPSNQVTADIEAVELSPTRPAPTTQQQAQPEQLVDVAAMDSTDKLLKALEYAGEHLGPDVRAQLAGLFTPESIAMMAGFAVAYVAAQLTPAGWVADGIALATLGITAIFVGRIVLDVAQDLYRFFSAVSATSDEQLRASGAALSHAVAEGGIAIVMAIIAHKMGGRRGGQPYEGPPPAGTVELLTEEGTLVRAPAQAAAEEGLLERAGPGAEGEGTSTQAQAEGTSTQAEGEGTSTQAEGEGTSTQAEAEGGSRSSRPPEDRSSGGPAAAPPVRGPEIFEEISREMNLDPASLETPRDPAAAAAQAQAAGFIGPRGAPGTVDVATQPHSAAPAVRGEYGVSGSDVQSMHIGPTSFLRNLPRYSRGAAETVLGDRPIHRAFDQTWKDWAMAQRRAGRTTVPVSELYSIMLDAINRIPGLSQRAKNAMAWRLQLELFRDLRLQPTDTVTLPYANIPAGH